MFLVKIKQKDIHMNLFKAEQKVPISIEEAWDFFSSPKNLAVITPPDMGFDITSDLPEKMYQGMFIAYKVAPMWGIKINWVTEITHIVEKKFFVDEQRQGPYRVWHHEHHFKEIPGGVLMTDILNYQLPLEPLGKIANGFVRERIEHIFEFRRKKIEEMFGKYEASSVQV
jgi:ligand-binding SRPBCC domain-containing protein